MNKSLVFLLPLLVAASGFGGVRPTRVAVYDSTHGQPAFTTTTTEAGTFATGNLPPGDYVVKFLNSEPAFKASSYALVIASGAKKVVAVDVPGEKFGGAGVAMRIHAGSGITGQIVDARTVITKPDPNIRVIAGVRYRWVMGGTGSNLGGHWVEDGAADASNLQRRSNEWLRNLQDQSGQGSMITFREHHGG